MHSPQKIVLQLLVCGLIFMPKAWGFETSTSGAPLTFQAWKEQQVLAAQNQLLRNSSKLDLLKSGKGTPSDKLAESTNLPSGRVKKTAGHDTILDAERDLKRAQESLESANNLQFDDYMNIYLPTLHGDPEMVAKLTEKLTREELAEICKHLIKKVTKPDDAKRKNPSILEDLTLSSRAKSR